jgi:hypothetical protein
MVKYNRHFSQEILLLHKLTIILIMNILFINTACSSALKNVRAGFLFVEEPKSVYSMMVRYGSATSGPRFKNNLISKFIFYKPA